jgi:ribonuclease Z
VERNCTANLLQIGSTNILFDAGRGVTTQLVKVGLHPRDIDYIFITHHHFDHIGNLGDLLMAAWNDGRVEPTYIFGPDGTEAIIDHLLNGIYRRDILFRLKESEFLAHVMPDIRDLVKVRDIPAQGGYETTEWSVHSEQVEHGHALGMTHEEWPCFGYRINAEGKVLAISGDTVDCDGVRALASRADLLVQCCYLAEAEIDNADKRVLSDHVLASAMQANRIAKAAHIKKMVLTHLAPKSDAMLAAVLTEAEEGLAAEVVVGADLMSFEI